MCTEITFLINYTRSYTSRCPNLRFVCGLLQDRLHHLISKGGRLRETGSKVIGDALEAVAVALKVPKGDTVGPSLARVNSLVHGLPKYINDDYDLPVQQM